MKCFVWSKISDFSSDPQIEYFNYLRLSIHLFAKQRGIFQNTIFVYVFIQYKIHWFISVLGRIYKTWINQNTNKTLKAKTYDSIVLISCVECTSMKTQEMFMLCYSP